MIQLPSKLINRVIFYDNFADYYFNCVSYNEYGNKSVKSAPRITDLTFYEIDHYHKSFKEFEEKYPDGTIVYWDIDPNIKEYITSKCDVDFLQKLSPEKSNEMMIKYFECARKYEWEPPYLKEKVDRYNFLNINNKPVSIDLTNDIEKIKTNLRLEYLEYERKFELEIIPLMVDLTPEDITYMLLMKDYK